MRIFNPIHSNFSLDFLCHFNFGLSSQHQSCLQFYSPLVFFCSGWFVCSDGRCDITAVVITGVLPSRPFWVLHVPWHHFKAFRFPLSPLLIIYYFETFTPFFLQRTLGFHILMITVLFYSPGWVESFMSLADQDWVLLSCSSSVWRPSPPGTWRSPCSSP